MSKEEQALFDGWEFAYVAPEADASVSAALLSATVASSGLKDSFADSDSNNNNNNNYNNNNNNAPYKSNTIDDELKNSAVDDILFKLK